MSENEAKLKDDSAISLYLKHTEGAAGAEIFRKWVAFWGVCACVERRVWIRTDSAVLYPNLFMFLLAPPGVGKDAAIGPMASLLRSKKVLLSPISMTDKGLLDELNDPSRVKDFIPPGGTRRIQYSALNACVPELGTLFSSHDLGFLSALNELYNCGDMYEEKIRTRKEKLSIQNPYLSILGGTQPQFLSKLFPVEAWGMGFMSRVICVYHGVPEKKSLFSQGTKGVQDPKATAKLKESLDWLLNAKGPMDVSADAAAALEQWHFHDSEKDKPDHPKLKDYCARRIIHLIKLCMLSALSEKSMQIEVRHFEYSLKMLLEAEHRMPEIFKEMSSGGQKDVSDEALHFLIQIYRRKGSPVSEQRLIEFLSRHVPSNQINYVIDNMIKMRMIKEVSNGGLNDTRPSAQKTRIRLFEPVGLSRSRVEL